MSARAMKAMVFGLLLVLAGGLFDLGAGRVASVGFVVMIIGLLFGIAGLFL